MKKKSNYIVAVLVLSMFVAAVLLSPQIGLFFGWVSPGWEIYNQVGAMEHNDVLYTAADQFTTPKELKGNYWKVDIDDENYAVPTMMCTLGDIHHVDFSGKDMPYDKYVDSITVVRGNSTFYLDYHIYLYTITIRTVADKYLYQRLGIGGMPCWKHETSWPHEAWDWYTDHGYNTYIGEEFSGGFDIKFIISPWTGVSYRSVENYTLTGAWAGVMNTYVLQKTQGQITNQWGETPDPNADAPMFVRAGIEPGNQVPMFADDGTFGTPAPIANWDPSLTPDVRISSSVVQYLPVEMQPGLKTHANAWGVVDEIYPCDVYVMYTLRVDVLQTHEFTLSTASQPPTPVTPSDYYSWAEDFWVALLNGINPFAIFGPYAPLVAFICLLGVIGVIFLVLLAIFAPWALARLARGLGMARRELSRGKKDGG